MLPLLSGPHIVRKALPLLLPGVIFVCGIAYTDAEEKSKMTEKGKEAVYMLEWSDCEKSYYNLMKERQQLANLFDNPKKSPCKTKRRIRIKKNVCPEDKKFSETPPDLRSMIDALMTQAPDDYPFAPDMNSAKVFDQVVKQVNVMFDAKCERIQEFDENN